MMVILDPVAEPYALSLLECLRTEIAQTIDPPAQVCMRAGDQVSFLIGRDEDECCRGLAWVRIVTVYPSGEQFPQPDELASNCGPLAWGVTLEMGSARCAPTGDANHIPSCDEWSDLAAKLAADDAAMRRALKCCFKNNDPNGFDDVTFLIGPSTPLPVEGGCTGITRTVIVQAPDLDCCDEGSP